MVNYTTVSMDKELSKRISRLASILGVTKIEVIRMAVELLEKALEKKGLDVKGEKFIYRDEKI